VSEPREIVIPLVPTRGYVCTAPRTDVPPNALTGPSSDWLVSNRRLRRRPGSAIFGDTLSAGVEVTGILPAKWAALCRRIVAASLKSLSDGYRTLLALFTEEATLHAGQLAFRNTNGTPSWRTVGAEWSATHYPSAPTAQPNLSVVPFVYRNQWGGLTLTRLKTELERRYLAAGSRNILQVGDEIVFPNYSGTPLRWNGRYNTATNSGSEKCEVFPTGLIPPLQVPTATAGTDLGTTVGPWKGSDAFFYTVLFENERGEWSAFPIPRPPNSAWVGYEGFGFFQVGAATPTHYFDRITLSGIACGPPGTRRRQILRTTKVDVAATSGAVFPPLASLGICGTLDNNTETVLILDDSNDLSLNFDPRIIEMVQRGLQWPPCARHLAHFDGHLSVADLRPNPCALILAPWSGGQANAPISGLTRGGAQVLYGATAYGVRVETVSETGVLKHYLRLRSVTGNNETDATYELGQFNLRKLVDRIMTGATTTTVVHDCLSYFAQIPLGSGLWQYFLMVDDDEQPVTDVEVGMHVVNANVPEDSVVASQFTGNGHTFFALSKPPYCAFASEDVTFWKNTAATNPDPWGIEVVPGADAAESCNELLRTYVAPLATWALSGTTVTLVAGATGADMAMHISPGMFVAAGAHFAAGTIITAVNVAAGTLTISAGAVSANDGASELVECFYDTGDETALTSSDHGGKGFVRSFGNAFPVSLPWRLSYLDAFPPQRFASQFSPASAGRPQDAVNTWHLKTRHEGPATLGPLVAIAECLDAQLEFHAHGIVELANVRDSNTHEDADYWKRVVDWGHGAASPYAVASIGDVVFYVNADGVFARSRGLAFVSIGGAIYDPGRPPATAAQLSTSPTQRGLLEYALLGNGTNVAGSCAAAESGADTHKVALSVVGNRLRLHYFSTSSSTYPDRWVEYDYSESATNEGLARVLDGNGRPFPWSPPQTLPASCMCELTNLTGRHVYAARDTNGGTGDGRVDEVDVGVEDQSADVVPVGYTGIYLPDDLSEIQPLRLVIVAKKDTTGLGVAIGANAEVAPGSDAWTALTVAAASNDYHKETLLFGNNVRSTRQGLHFKITDSGTHATTSDWPEIVRLNVHAMPCVAKPNK